MHRLADKVILAGVIEGVNFQEGAPASMQSYTIRLADGQALHTNVKNIVIVPTDPVLETLDLVPTGFHALGDEATALEVSARAAEPRQQAPKPRKVRAPHNARLPRVEGM